MIKNPFPDATGRGVRVAVIDSGVNAAHPHITGVAGGLSFPLDGPAGPDFADRLGHGTAVMAAIQKAIQDNLTKAGVTGVTVNVSGGVATLTGKLPKAQWQKALQAANEANPKPTRVQNQITE